MDEVIEKFYSAFKRLDAEAMVDCYHKDIIFEDPAFGILKGSHAANMWRMLISSQNGKEFRVTYSDISSKDSEGSAKWEAQYIFSKTGRPVHNKIIAHFEFKDGKIYRHTDYFNLREWSIQAFGFKGWLLGGTSFFKKKLNEQTNAMLTKFEAQIS